MSKRHLVCLGAFVLALGAVHTSCVDEEDVEVGVDELEGVNLAPRTSEVLVLDVTESMDRGWRGKRMDYHYPLDGRKISDHHFEVATRGSANAYIESIDDNHVKVHAWADAFSGYTFTLKVWVKQ